MAISADIQQQVFDLLSRASNLSFVSAEEETAGATRLSLTPGQKVTAEILTKFSDNRVQVQIGSERFNMQLPVDVRQGQSLELTFVSADPRSTFAIARPAGAAQPVSLSDASRLLGLLVGTEQVVDPQLRSSLQSVSDILRRTSGTGVLANLMDEAITYGNHLQEEGKGAAPAGQASVSNQKSVSGTENSQQLSNLSADQTRLTVFESNAARILENIARNSRFILAEATSQPVVPLPLLPGEEVDATVLGTLPGGRAFVQIAGTTLELKLPRTLPSGEILRLTYISSQPKPLFAIPRSEPDLTASTLSGAGRWLSVLEHNQGGLSDQQVYVLERLNTILKSLPSGSPAFTAIQDEAITYHALGQGRQPAESLPLAAQVAAGNPSLIPGNGIILTDDMAKLLQALIKGNRLALLEAINQQAAPLGFVAGQQLKGEVLAALGGGRFLVQVAEQTFEFNMPKGIRKNDLLNLFFISDETHPIFLMARFGRSGDSRVSDTGRWLSGFLGATVDQPAESAPGLLKTLLGEQPKDATLVGRQLQQGLRESGLFYESHLSRWFQGDFPLEKILREPQGRLSELKQSLLVQNADVNPTGEETASGFKLNSLENMEAIFKKAGETRGHEGIADQRTLPVVREQLEALQAGQVIFRGELFPGQQMEWKVSERESQRNSSGERERAWNTELRLDLPKLGNVKASLKVDGNRVSIEMVTDEVDSADALNTGRSGLIEQLEAAGLAPAIIEVRHETP